MEPEGEVDVEHGTPAVAPSSQPPAKAQGSAAGGGGAAPRRGLDCSQRVSAVFCSHVGVAIVLGAYSVMGAFLFQAIELPAEREARSPWPAQLQQDLDEVWTQVEAREETSGEARYDKANFTEDVRRLLDEYRGLVGWQGRGPILWVDPDDPFHWNFVGSLLYSITIMTTVGYGHLTPRTPWGRLLTIIYGLIGIPLTVIYLVKMGALLADGFRVFYQRVCCDLCCCKRCERARRRRRSTLLYQTRSEALYPYRVGYSRQVRPGSDVAEVGVDGGSDVTQGLLAQNESVAYLRDSDAATCVNMAFHGSLPRAAGRPNRDWRTQSSHVYETISLMDDVTSGQLAMRSRPKLLAAGADSLPSRVSHGKTTWNHPEHHAPSTDKATGTLERRSGGDRDRTGDKKGDDGKYSSLRKQLSQPPKLEQRSSRSSGPEPLHSHSLPRTKKPGERIELRPNQFEKQKRSTTVRRITASSPSLVRAKPASTGAPANGRRQKRTGQTAPTKTSRHQHSDRKRKERRRGMAGTEEESPTGNGRKISNHLGQSDESFFTAPDDSSTDVASTDTGSLDDEPEVAARRRRKSSQDTQKAKKKTATKKTEKRRKRELEKDGEEALAAAGLPLTAISVEDAESKPEVENKAVSVICTDSEGDGGGGVYPRRKIRVPIGVCLLVMLTYVFAGSLGFCLWEGWDYSTGPYFCFVSLTTIGFGDFVPGAGPNSAASTEKLVVCTIWLVVGLTLLAMCGTLISEHFGKKAPDRRGQGRVS